MQAIHFLKEVREELNKVVWPTREQTMRLTVMVLGVSLFVGFFLGGIDYLLTELTKIILK